MPCEGTAPTWGANPMNSPTPSVLTFRGKMWHELTTDERFALCRENIQLYRAMRKVWRESLDGCLVRPRRLRWGAYR